MSALENLADNYNSSDSEENSDLEVLPKRKKLNPLPKKPSLLPVPDIFAKKQVEIVDKPEQHLGRIRSFPHERGNWSTYVYIHYPASEKISSLTNQILEECGSVCELHVTEDYHISLSRTFVLKFHWINTFITSLKQSLSTVERFCIIFDSLEIYCNDEQTRTFIGLKVGADSAHELTNIVDKIDPLLLEFKLTPYYKDPSFHTSLLWCTGNKTRELQPLLANLQKICAESLAIADNNYIHDYIVESLVCKSGNKTFNFNLM